MLLANLAPELERRPAPEDPAQALAAYSDGLTTAELLAVMECDEAEKLLIERVADGAIERESLGDGALWHLARPTGRFTAAPGDRAGSAARRGRSAKDVTASA